MKLCLLVLVGICALTLVKADSLVGGFRKRFSGNPTPGLVTPQEYYYRTGLDIPTYRDNNNNDAPCCKPVYRTSQPRPDPGQSSNKPNIPPPVRPTIYFQEASYRVVDRHHGREKELELFNPEDWVRTNPGQAFPADLDVPNRWYVYNAVTVQAPLPFVDERALRERVYTGYYYACPEKVSPYKFSWMMKNDPVNPCKWIFYQSVKDAGRHVLY